MATKATFNPDAISKNAVLVDLRLHCWGQHRSFDQEQHQTVANEFDAEVASVRAAKVLLQSEEYSAIVSEQIEVARYLRNKSLPGTVGVFKRGVYVVAASEVPEIDDAIQNGYVHRLDEKIDELIAALPKLKSKDKKRLGDLFDEKDYPSADALKHAISISVVYRPIPLGAAPDAVKGIKASIYRREVAKAQAEVKTFQQTVVKGITAEYAKFVQTLADRLAPSTNGEVKRFKQPVLDKLSAFCEAIDNGGAWSFATADEVKVETRKLKKLLSGVSFDDLKDKDARAQFAAQITPFAAQAAKLVETASRGFRL